MMSQRKCHLLEKFKVGTFFPSRILYIFFKFTLWKIGVLHSQRNLCMRATNKVLITIDAIAQFRILKY
jgi:hypothetical protein